jgi:hypothetical protein
VLRHEDLPDRAAEGFLDQAPASWHCFHPASFDLGRDLLPLTAEL